MSRPRQTCAEPGCLRPAAFTTRTKPAWCDHHITALLAVGGLEPLEPFTKPTAWRLTRCTSCGCVAHYLLEYTLDQNSIGQATCRACHWRKWAEEARRVQGAWAKISPTEPDVARAHAEEHGYEYLGALTEPSLPDDPHRTRCVYCGRLSAQRLGDIGWGCSCQTNPRRAAQTANLTGPRTKALFRDSKLPAVDWWDHELNDPVEFSSVVLKARREAKWCCPDCDHRFTARITDMTSYLHCPECTRLEKLERDAEYERLRRTPISEVQVLAAAWADEGDPATVLVTGHQLRRFRCAEGHHPRTTPWNYLHSGCPVCRGQHTRREHAADPAAQPRLNREIASQWHPSKNPRLSAAAISPGSRRKVWWLDPDCGHEWQATPAEREKGQRLRCPVCRTILDSLAYHYPEIAAEWSPTNPVTAWRVRPSGSTAFTPEWVCAANPKHVWTGPLASRAAGTVCPHCRETGKSRVELAHFVVAEATFATALSGQPVKHEAFVRRPRWVVDIVATTHAGQPVAIEYDGAYWHADKIDIDTAKSVDLIAAGYLVARLRERPLLPLRVDSDRFFQMSVDSVIHDPARVIAQVRDWADSLRI